MIKDYYSHPNYLLRNHLKDVTKNIENLFYKRNVNYEEWGVDRDRAYDYFRLMGLCHDFGKYSSFFQRHLLDDSNLLTQEEVKLLKMNPELGNHSLISAFALLTLSDLIFTEKVEREGLIQYAVFHSIVKHHSNLTNFDFFKDYNIDQLDLLIVLFNHVNLEEFIGLINDFFKTNITKEELSKLFIDKVDIWKKEISKNNGVITTSYVDFFKLEVDNPSEFWKDSPQSSDYLFVIWTFSLLIYSDKFHAIFKDTIENETFTDKSDYVDEFKKKNNFIQRNQLDKEREDTYQIAARNIQSKDLSQKLHTLTMNTGYGKTLTSLNVALKLQKRLYEEKQQYSRIIMAMPYTAIIEQNYGVVEGVLNVKGDKVDSRQLIKHHYLSSPTFTDEKTEIDLEKNESKFLTQTWDSNLIFTTFVQILETFFTNKNKKLVRFPNLINSIIILDEVQTIDPDLLMAFERISEALAKYFNTYIISCSATQPYYQEGFRSSLIDNYADYYKTERTQLILKDISKAKRRLQKIKITKEEFLEFATNLISEEKNYLIIVNTKKMAQETYLHLKSKLGEDYQVFCLSNTQIPLDKVRVVNQVQSEIKNNKRNVLISTQLIEAGVDVDFDVAIRDFCPLPNLLQSVGRVNRNFRHPNFYGEMYIVNIENQCLKIYNETSLDLTYKTLLKFQEDKIIKENIYLDLNEFFFKELREVYSTVKSLDILNALTSLNLKDIDFKLIEELDGQITVFIQKDELSKELFERYINLDYRGVNRRIQFEEFKLDFMNYTLKISKRDLLKALAPYLNNITVNQEEIFNIGEYSSEVYSEEYGFKLVKYDLLEDDFFI